MIIGPVMMPEKVHQWAKQQDHVRQRGHVQCGSIEGKHPTQMQRALLACSAATLTIISTIVTGTDIGEVLTGTGTDATILTSIARSRAAAR
jgi:hypothetical protein